MSFRDSLTTEKRVLFAVLALVGQFINHHCVKSAALADRRRRQSRTQRSLHRANGHSTDEESGTSRTGSDFDEWLFEWRSTQSSSKLLLL